jgi:hypothetical protein
MGRPHNMHDEIRNAYDEVLVGKLEGKKPLGRTSCRWVDGIIMELSIIDHEVVNWIHLVQDRNQW